MTEVVRLSSWVREIAMPDGGAYFKHGLTGERFNASAEQRSELRLYTRFRNLEASMSRPREMGLLVAPGEDPICANVGSSATAESRIRSLWAEAYWDEEIELEREYQWQGQAIVKMPEDLFLYQELLQRPAEQPSVLELGAAPGGSAQFFVDMLSLRSGGLYVGVDRVVWQTPEPKHPWAIHAQVLGDAHSPAVLHDATTRLGRWGAALFDLIVIDADADRMGRVKLLEQYAPLVGVGGWIVVEDLSMPDQDPHRSEIGQRLDQFLLDHRGFGIELAAGRFMCAKSTRACFRRYE